MQPCFEAPGPSVSWLFVSLISPSQPLLPNLLETEDRMRCVVFPRCTKAQCIWHTLAGTKDKKRGEAWTRRTPLPGPIKTLQKVELWGAVALFFFASFFLPKTLQWQWGKNEEKERKKERNRTTFVPSYIEDANWNNLFVYSWLNVPNKIRKVKNEKTNTTHQYYNKFRIRKIFSQENKNGNTICACFVQFCVPVWIKERELGKTWQPPKL